MGTLQLYVHNNEIGKEGVEALASRLEAIALRLEAMAIVLVTPAHDTSMTRHRFFQQMVAAGGTWQALEEVQARRRASGQTNFKVQEWLDGSPVNKKLLVAKGIATRSKDATSSSWPYY